MDYHLGQLLKEIYDPESLIIITADHGELLGEHGLFGHPSELYENLLRIPLLIKLPDSLSIYIKTKQIDVRVRSVDIVPTILDILEITSETNLDGCSLLPLIKGELNNIKSIYTISEVGRKKLCVYKKQWKFILNDLIGEKKLVNIDNDPHEENNLLSVHPNIAHELESYIRKYVAEIESKYVNPTPMKTNDEIKEKLKSLGYM